MSTSAIDLLQVSRFGPFGDACELSFAPGVNVIVGDNGTGKSQLLKLLYSCTQVLQDDSFEHTKTALQHRLAQKLVGVFRPDSLGRLVTRQQGRSKTEVGIAYEGSASPLRFSFATNSKTEVRMESTPAKLQKATPVFLPSRELMSIYPGFVSLYDTHQLEFDETMRDTCSLLGLPPMRRNARGVALALRPIEDILEGHVAQVNGRFYLNGRPEGNFEMPLLAEGLRKLSTIAQLVQCGVLVDEGYLFWDEPEANLNPASQVAVVQSIIALARNGIQVFLGTHSAFLLRQLSLDMRQEKSMPSIRFTALRRDGERHTHVRIMQGDGLDDIDLDYLASIRSEYKQADAILSE